MILINVEFKNLCTPKIIAKNPLCRQVALNPNATIPLDIPVEGIMTLEVFSNLDGNVCCDYQFKNPAKCPQTNVLGKPIFSRLMRPATFENVSRMVAFVPLDFEFAAVSANENLSVSTSKILNKKYCDFKHQV